MGEQQDPAGDAKETMTSSHGEANSRLAPPSSDTEDIGLKWLALNGSESGAEYQQHLGLLERTEMVANMSNGTSDSIEEINTYYFYEGRTANLLVAKRAAEIYRNTRLDRLM
uniref:Uncharacterized protein n=1 Tax=Anopheles atroparvus TaxID=41427 RepID=A0A182IQ46_ANOAO